MTHLTANATAEEVGVHVASDRTREGGAEPLPDGWATEGAPPERVSAAALAQMIDECTRVRPEIGIAWLCEHASVGRNTVRDILRRQRTWVDVYIADRLCVALGRHLDEAGPVERPRPKRIRR